MKPIGYIFLGIVIGVALTLTATYILAAFSRPAPVQDKTLEALNSVMDKELESLLHVESIDTNYYNIETNKGTVVLFTGMTKDSIISLLGEPQSFHTMSELGTEDLNYNTTGGYINDLHLTLEKGKLTDVSKL